ncbi:transporter substrate-binding domain-containing protein [Paenibacillus sp. GCM10012307]|uniref:Amino acid ABC transporter substrate-binding protein n=1 Tax=Paenibacillus roseus TaxID=2798579 RepID=A0A934J070_9BACL|nr:amino acid ABC transporter substrate-binding protein [Paenibacillus roseus]MBJ6362432.1 amino acid ABC transporter substrate-binding protein [Paenibacillus roseus]
MKKLSMMILVMGLVVLALAGCGGKKAEDTAAGNSGSASGKKIIVGIDDKFAPMGFRDDNNEIVGFDIDYARAAGEQMGREMVFQPIDWKSKESELKSGRIDLIWNGYTINEDRKTKVLFTKPYLRNSQVVAVLNKSDVTKLSDLEGKEVGLQSLSSAADALDGSELKSKVKVSEYADNVLALSDLKNGRTAAVVIDEIVIKYYMSKEHETFKLLDEVLSPEEYGIGVKQGNEELLNELQAALDELNKNGKAAEISVKWFGEDKVLK